MIPARTPEWPWTTRAEGLGISSVGQTLVLPGGCPLVKALSLDERVVVWQPLW